MLNQDLNRFLGKYFGKYAGEVTDNEDKDQRGRVKVRVESIFGAELQVWARPCVPYGHFFIPAVGTQVWVEFEGGDLEHPIWVGVFYKDGDVPEKAAVNPPDNRVVHTASGHLIELSDKESEERITITHKGEHKIEIDHDGVVTIQQKDGHKLTFSKDDVTLENKEGAKLILKGSEVTVDAQSIVLGGSGAMFKPISDVWLMQAWSMLASHTHSCAVGPTSPPVPPLMPPKSTDFSSVVKFK